MTFKESLFTDTQIRELVEVEEIPTPFHLYDEAGIRRSARRLNAVFDWVEPLDGIGYINYFAAKATPNPHIFDILREEGMGTDASSGPEIELALAAGMKYPFIMFTSNNTAPEEYAEAHRAGAIINLDDINQIDVLQAALGGNFTDTLSFRYNPGSKKSGGVNNIIGVPEESKFGVPDSQLEEAYRRAKKLGVEHFGIHTMVASNELDAMQHVATAEIVFRKVAELSKKLGITFEFANLGGGLGIPYRPEEKPVDYALLRRGIKAAYEEHIIGNGLPPLRIVTENGRHVLGPNAVTVFRARSIKEGGRHRIVGLDGSTGADGPRPAMYDAYHHATVVGKWAGVVSMQRLVGSLCEDNDYFTGAITKDRMLPIIEENDLVVMHDTGAHWYAMANNYNAKMRAAEYMWQRNSTLRKIRRAETRDDLFATLDHPRLRPVDQQG
jgi:diaminopimelate decarboxylase